MTYKCLNFEIEELVSQATYNSFIEMFGVDIGEEFMWRLFDDNFLEALDALRDKYGPITINDWCWGGSYDQSGLRTTFSQYYSKGSMHSWACAVDMKFGNFTAPDIQKLLEELTVDDEYGDVILAGITRVERGTPTWTHVDNKDVSKDTLEEGLYFFNP